MSQIGFVLITHTAPNQIVRLIRALTLLYSNPPIVVHHDFGQCPAELSLPSNVRVVQPHIPTQWCNYSVVRATLAGLALLYANHEKPDWFVLLSGACRTFAITADLSTLDGVRAAAEATYAHFGKVDVLVNNAGMTNSFEFLDAEPEALARTVDVNLRAVVVLTRLVAARARAPPSPGGG